MSHQFSETRYYVLDSVIEDDFYGCPIQHFRNSEEAINFCDALKKEGKITKVEEVTWISDSHRSHSVIYSSKD